MERNIEQSYTRAEKYIGKRVHISIDRRLGSTHPKFPDLRYPVNYGYVPGTKAPDGAELDAYILGVHRPISDFEGICVAVIRRAEEADDKLIVVPETMKECSNAEIRKLTRFQERYFHTKIIRNNVAAERRKLN